ncbi:hypothetical protein [Candidatus Uabimicrobium sp. HlEnr_7]|uniref:hypothetical protein n=1 Tax=Candidatus Uabimicrobium helgolandensis TaxID=3095367 RepID=UPI0035590866
MKHFILLMLVFVMAVCPYAAEEAFDLQVDENGESQMHDDFGWKILLVDGSIDQDCHVELYSVSTREVYFSGDVKAGEKFAINAKTSAMGLKVKNAVAGTTAKCTVQWKLSKTVELLSMAMPSGNKGQCYYKSVVRAEDGASIRVNNFMTSHDCRLYIAVDGKTIFNEDVEAGKVYSVTGVARELMKVKVKKAPRFTNIHVSLDTEMIGEAMFSRAQEQDQELLDILNMEDEQELYKVEFDQNTDEHGCVDTDAYNLSPKGINPQIRMLILDKKFADVVLKINDVNLRPELILTFNKRYYYKVDFGLKSGDELALGLFAEGAKPSQSCHFLFVCQNFEETK